MTRLFGVHYTCQHCGQLTSAETGFGRWMRAQPRLESASGIVRTDTDHTILRYKTHPQGREFQLMMEVEVKEYGGLPRPDQKDIFNFRHQLMGTGKVSKNINGGKIRRTRRLYSLKNRKYVLVRWLGCHLLRFERTCPDDSEWIEWDHKRVTAHQVIDLIAMNVDPNNPSRSMVEMLRDRHARKQLSFLFLIEDDRSGKHGDARESATG